LSITFYITENNAMFQILLEVMDAESQAVLNTLTEHDFRDAFTKWQKRWERCIPVGEKLVFWPDGSTSPGNYGYVQYKSRNLSELLIKITVMRCLL
jgi:hypothetical protein